MPADTGTSNAVFEMEERIARIELRVRECRHSSSGRPSHVVRIPAIAHKHAEARVQQKSSHIHHLYIRSQCFRPDFASIGDINGEACGVDGGEIRSAAFIASRLPLAMSKLSSAMIQVFDVVLFWQPETLDAHHIPHATARFAT